MKKDFFQLKLRNSIMPVIGLICLFHSMDLSGQAWREVMPIVEENKVWINEMRRCLDYDGNVYHTKYVMSGDTAIGKYVYKKVQVQPYCDSLIFMRETDTYYGFLHDIFEDERPPGYKRKFVYAYYSGNKYENLLYSWQRYSGVQHELIVYNDSQEIFRYTYGSAFSGNFYTGSYYPALWDIGTNYQLHYWTVDHWRERVGSVKDLFYNKPQFFTFDDYVVKCVFKDDTLLYSNLGTSENCVPFTADFTFSDQCLGDTTQIQFHSCEELDSIIWDLGDGTTISLNGAIRKISHYYPQPGNYPVSIIAIRGTDKLKLNKQLVIREKPKNIDLGPDTVICGDQYQLSANIQAYKYFWSTGANGPDLTVNQSGTYSLIAGHNSCFTTDTVDVRIFKTPEIKLDTVYSTCGGKNLRLFAGTQNYNMSYAWSNGGTGAYSDFYDSGWHYLKITNGSCYDSSSFYIKVKPSPENFPEDTLFYCSEDTFALRSSDPNSIVQVYGIQDSVFYFTQDTLIQIQLIQNGCSVSQKIAIQKDIPQTAVSQRHISACEGDSVQFKINLHPGERLSWFDGDTLPFKIFSPIVADTLSVQINNNTCQKTDSIFLVPLSKQSSPFVQKEFDKCPGENKMILLPSGFRYFLDNILMEDSLLLGEAGDMIILMTDSNECKLSDTLKVREPKLLKSLDTAVCTALPFELYLSDPSVQIEPGGFEVNSSYLRFHRPGLYLMEVKDAYSCESLEWKLLLETDCPKYYIPTGFSPNHDGLNDGFGLDIDQPYRMIIFNRWGEIIFEETGEDLFWDGRYKGQNCPAGLYSYIITLNKPVSGKRTLSGTVQLLR